MSRLFSSVSAKVSVGYVAVLLVSVITALLLANTSRGLQSQVQDFVDSTLPQLADLQALSFASQELQIHAFSLYGTSIKVAVFDERHQQHQQQISRSLEGLADLEGLAALSRFLRDFEGALLGVRRVMSASQIDWDAARVQLGRLSEQAEALSRQLDMSTRRVESRAADNSMMMIDDLASLLHLIILLVVVTLLVALAAYFFSRRQVAEPIQGLAATLNQVAEHHDLTRQLPIESNDEIGRSAQSVNHLLLGFHTSISEVSGAIGGISHEVSDLSATSAEADRVVTELNTTIERLVALMGQLENCIEQSSGRSESAAQMAVDGAQEVNVGAEKVNETALSVEQLAENLESTAAMLLELRSSGDQVSGVVGTIAEIADQTNLLALNAAIEAARAGESGRGFAVVADEVRALASKTHQSTVEINDMLEKIVSSITRSVSNMEKNQQQAKASVALAQGTVTSLADISQSILALRDECHSVTGLAADAKSEVRQTTDVVGQFQQLGERVSVASRGVQTASQSLASLASNLSQQVARFKL